MPWLQPLFLPATVGQISPVTKDRGNAPAHAIIPRHSHDDAEPPFSQTHIPVAIGVPLAEESRMAHELLRL